MSRVEASSRWATFKEAQDTLRPCAHAHIPKLLLCTCSPPPLTCTHRYKLLDFDPSYAQEAAPLQRKLDLCSRAAAVLAKTPSLAVEAGYEALRQADISSANAQGGPSWDAYTKEEVREEAGFLYSQLAAWSKVRGQGGLATDCRVLYWVHRGGDSEKAAFCTYSLLPGPR